MTIIPKSLMHPEMQNGIVMEGYFCKALKTTLQVTPIIGAFFVSFIYSDMSIGHYFVTGGQVNV